MYACLCKAITDKEVRSLGRSGVTDPEALIAALGLEDEVCCGRCKRNIDQFVEIASSWERQPAPLSLGRLLGLRRSRAAAL